LSQAFSFKIGEYRYNSGNNTYNAISIWIIENTDETKIAQENARIVKELQNNAPQYHTRAMRLNYFRTCELLLPKVKAALLRTIYRMITGDTSAAESANEAKVDAHHNEGRPEKYKVFWNVAARFLAGKAADFVVAVDERRHDQIVHLATAISVNDLCRQIERECPYNTPIP
ncbi:9292_t:CDS:2, partial [Scutellospora calospora]